MLLLDEPLSALDAKVRAQLRDEIRRVQLEVGTTTLFVTHDQEEALAVADRVGVMNAGRLEQIAPPAELYAHPTSRFVAEFVGLSNRVPAEVSGGTADAAAARRSRRSTGPSPRAVGWPSCGPSRSPSPPTPTGPPRSRRSASSARSPASTLDLPDGQHLMAQVPSSAAVGLSPGDRVRVGVDPTPVLVIEG